MTDNKMTPEQFVKEWLRDYERRLDDWKVRYYQESFYFTVPQFHHDHFPEALAAYTVRIRKETWDQASRKQREVCSDIVLDCELVSIGYCEPQDTARKVENAPTPEFKLTEKE